MNSSCFARHHAVNPPNPHFTVNPYFSGSQSFAVLAIGIVTILGRSQKFRAAILGPQALYCLTMSVTLPHTATDLMSRSELVIEPSLVEILWRVRSCGSHGSDCEVVTLRSGTLGEGTGYHDDADKNWPGNSCNCGVGCRGC
jgi:hypothetical protein